MTGIPVPKDDLGPVVGLETLGNSRLSVSVGLMQLGPLSAVQPAGTPVAKSGMLSTDIGV